MADQQNQLQVILKEQHVPKAQAEALIEAFGGPFTEVGEILADYQTIKVTDVNDQDGMTKARVKRLALKKARTTVENKRKELKEGIVKQGRAIDSIARFVKETIAPAEQYLQLQEDFAKLEAARKHEDMLAERREQLTKLGANPDMYNYQGLPAEAFEQLIFDIERENKRLADEAAAQEAERAKQAEAEKVAQARRDRDAKRLRAVNALGIAVYESGKLERGTFTADSYLWPDLLELDDKAFDQLIADIVKAANKYDERQAAERKAEQARQAKITERVNWLSSLGAMFNGTDYRLAAKRPGSDGAVVSKQEVETDSDEAFAKALQLVENVSKDNAKFDDEQAAELQAARDKAAADEQARLKAEADERAALLAPDKTKLITLADGLEMVRTSKLPALKTKQAQEIVNDIDADLTRLIANIRAKADRLK